MYVIRSISIKTSFLLHKNLPDLILGGYIKALTIYPPVATIPVRYSQCIMEKSLGCIIIYVNPKPNPNPNPNTNPIPQP